MLYYKSSGTPDSRGNNKEEEEYKPSQNTDFSDCSLFWIQRGNDGTLNWCGQHFVVIVFKYCCHLYYTIRPDIGILLYYWFTMKPYVSGLFLDDNTVCFFSLLKAVRLHIIASIHFIWTLVESCLIGNHTISPYFI